MRHLVFCALLGAALSSLPANAAYYTVTGTADGTNSAVLGGSGTPASPYQIASLRGATIAANANPGSTIILPAGKYQLTIPGDFDDRNFMSFNPTNGDLDIYASGITIQGAGPASTTIEQTTGADRILTDNPNSVIGYTFTMTGITLTGGVDTTDFEGGGAIFVGGESNLTIISNCVFVNNQVTGGTGAGTGGGSVGGGALCNTGGNLNVVNCTFGGTGATDPNVSTFGGGALAFDSSDFVHNGGFGLETVSGCTFMSNSESSTTTGGAVVISDSNESTAAALVTNCVFKGNKNTEGNGGAIAVNSGSLTVTACLFDSNEAQGTGHGGAIRSAGGTTNTVTYSRFVTNSAATPADGNVLSFGSGGGSFTANNNWWGQNTGPAANAIDASSGSASIAATTWLQVKLTANPNTIFVPNSATLTATFLTNSAGTTIPAADLLQLVGVPIAFNSAVDGSLSGAQTSIQSSGTATAIFTANTAGTGSAAAVVDNQTDSVSITIPTGVSSINRVNAATNNLDSVQWTVAFSNAVSGVVAGNFSLVNTGLGGTPTITSVAPVGGAPAATWAVTASTGSGSGTLGLNMANASGLSANVANLPFTGQVYTIDFIPPTVTCSSNITVTASGHCPVVVNFSVSVSDNDGVANSTTNPASGSAFPIGTNTVTVTARDTAGNSNFCTFTVTVFAGPAPDLSIAQAGANVIVSWPDTFPCYALQTAPGLAPTNVWTTYAGSLTTNAGKIFVTNSPSSTNLFYRLAD
jgi:hypothetical protein